MLQQACDSVSATMCSNMSLGKRWRHSQVLPQNKPGKLDSFDDVASPVPVALGRRDEQLGKYRRQDPEKDHIVFPMHY